MSEGKDLTKGNLLSNMVKFCLPLLFTNLLNSIYNIVDGIWIGRLVGDNGLAATTNCWPIILAAGSVFTGVTVTTSVLVAQHFASKDREKIKEIITPMYIISLIMGILTSLTVILTEDFWFNLFNTPLEIRNDAKSYLTCYSIGFIFDFVAFTAIEGIRAIGNSKTPLFILAITEIINIILDPIFIKLGYGVKGAAIATAISMLILLIISFMYTRKSELLKFNRKYLIFKKEFLKKVSSLGIPMIAQQLFAICTIMLEVNVSNSLGIIGASTYAIVSKFQEVVWVIGNSMNQLLTVVVGQFIGKKEYNRVKEAIKNGLKLGIIPMSITAIFVVFFSGIFARVFTENKDVLKEAVGYMHIVGIGYTLVPICQVLYGFILGCGKTKYAFVASVSASITEIVLILIINNKFVNKEFMALGIGISSWYIVEIALFAIYYYSKRWMKESYKL